MPIVHEWWETLDVALFIHRIIGHFHITLTDCLTFDTTKVNGLFLGIFTYNLHDREPIGRLRDHVHCAVVGRSGPQADPAYPAYPPS